MSTPLLPQAFWFRMKLACRRVDGLPKPGGRPLDLPDSCRLPDFGALEGKESWSEARIAWNPAGLALSFRVKGKVGPIVYDPTRPFASDGVQFWIDTRDTRDIHRASRFCSRFVGSILSTPKGIAAELVRKPIARAIADPPPLNKGEAIDVRTPGQPDPGGLAGRTLPAGGGLARLRPRDQPQTRLRISGGHGPRAGGPIPRRRPRLSDRRGSESLGNPRTS